MFYSTRTELASHTLWQTLKFDEMDFLCLFWASFLGTFFLWVHLGWTYLNQCHVALRNCVTVRLFEALLLHGENQVKFFSREKKNAVSEQKPRCKIFLITSSYCCRTSEKWTPHEGATSRHSHSSDSSWGFVHRGISLETTQSWHMTLQKTKTRVKKTPAAVITWVTVFKMPSLSSKSENREALSATVQVLRSRSNSDEIIFA